VEISSHDLLAYRGMVDLTAANGLSSTLLLDPHNVTISTAADSGIGCAAGTCSPVADGSVLSVATLETALASSNVIVNTGTSGTQSGDITVANAVTWASGNTLTLSAARDVIVNAGISVTNGGGFTATAERNVTVNSSLTSASGAFNVMLTASGSAGSLTISNATVNTNGGSLTAIATQVGASTAVTLNNAIISLGNGSGTITAHAAAGKGLILSGASQMNAGAGTLSLIGSSTGSDATIYIGAGASLATSGTVSVAGTATTVGRGFQVEGGTINVSGLRICKRVSSNSRGILVAIQGSTPSAGGPDRRPGLKPNGCAEICAPSLKILLVTGQLDPKACFMTFLGQLSRPAQADSHGRGARAARFENGWCVEPSPSAGRENIRHQRHSACSLARGDDTAQFGTKRQAFIHGEGVVRTSGDNVHAVKRELLGAKQRVRE
jgi:hypothetical protein